MGLTIPGGREAKILVSSVYSNEPVNETLRKDDG
jgi:hypothetical protein